MEFIKDYWFIGLLVLAALAIIPAFIASSKGYSKFGYYLFGFFLFPFALSVACLLPSKKYDNLMTDNMSVLIQVLDDKFNELNNTIQECKKEE
jgi:hypothetical protein